MAEMQMDVWNLLRMNCGIWLEEAQLEKWWQPPERAEVSDYPFLTGLGCFALGLHDLGFDYWRQASESEDRLLHHLRSHITFFLKEETARSIVADSRCTQLLDDIAMGARWTEEVQRRARTLTASTGIPIGEPWI